MSPRAVSIPARWSCFHLSSSVTDATFFTFSVSFFWSAAQTDSKLWVIDRKSYQTILMQSGLNSLSHSVELLSRWTSGRCTSFDVEQAQGAVLYSNALSAISLGSCCLQVTTMLHSGLWRWPKISTFPWHVSDVLKRLENVEKLNQSLCTPVTVDDMWACPLCTCVSAVFPSCSHCQRMSSWKCLISWRRYRLSS